MGLAPPIHPPPACPPSSPIRPVPRPLLPDPQAWPVSPGTMSLLALSPLQTLPGAQPPARQSKGRGKWEEEESLKTWCLWTWCGTGGRAATVSHVTVTPRGKVTKAREVRVHRPSNSTAGIGVKGTARLARARVLSYFRGGVRSPPI